MGREFVRAMEVPSRAFEAPSGWQRGSFLGEVSFGNLSFAASQIRVQRRFRFCAIASIAVPTASGSTSLRGFAYTSEGNKPMLRRASVSNYPTLGG